MNAMNPSPGASIAEVWAPQDVWDRVAISIRGIYAQKSFASTCVSASVAMFRARAPALARLYENFHLCAFTLPDSVIDKVLMAHVVPSNGAGLVLFVDESESGDGIELVWLSRGMVRRVPLGLETVPASAVSNIRFAPDGRSVALLVTLAHGSLASPGADPLRRLRGWDMTRNEQETVFNVKYDPCDDCTVQVVDFCEDSDGYPSQLVVHTFSHVFVPEYGFDMVWRRSGCDGTHQQEVAFAALLHSDTGAATYLVRWKTLRRPEAENFIFMACIDGASVEFTRDKRMAMMTHLSTVCTSRIELANDAQHIFFDTLSKFGILRFDQVEDASMSTVTRADLYNNPVTQWWKAPPGRLPWSPLEPRSSFSQRRRFRPDEARTAVPSTFRVPCAAVAGFSNGFRISRMSPNGRYLCSVVSPCHSMQPEHRDALPSKHIEMRSSATGRLMYRRILLRPSGSQAKVARIKVRLEKSTDVAHHTLLFSDDSSLLLVWDTLLTSTHCLVVPRLPIVLDTGTGSLVQDFGPLLSSANYENLQMSPDAQTMYGTRMEDDRIKMDAVDVLSGRVLKTVSLTSTAVHPPKHFSAHSIYLLPNRRLHTVSRGNVDVLWDTTRGSLGCGWSSHLVEDSEGQCP